MEHDHVGLLQQTSHPDSTVPLPATPLHYPSYEAESKSVQMVPYVIKCKAVEELVASRAFSAVAKQSVQQFTKVVEVHDIPEDAGRLMTGHCFTIR